MRPGRAAHLLGERDQVDRTLGSATFAAGIGAPVALTLATGWALADAGSEPFDLLAALITGALTVIAGTTAFAIVGRVRPAPTIDLPSPALPESGEPRVGSRVLVRTHFTNGGGYVAHGPMLFWATAPGARPEWFTPGTECVVTGVERATLAVAYLTTEGAAGGVSLS